MKRITTTVQRLSQRAADLRQFVEAAPPKLVQIRDTVTAATGHVQKLRADIISSVSTLRSETDTQLVTTLREIDGAADVFAAAGFHLEGVDMDLGPTRRLIVQLERVEDVDKVRIRALHFANAQRPAVQALLAALIKAHELADKVELTNLSYTRLTIEVGLIPTVRIGWRAEDGTDAEAASASALSGGWKAAEASGAPAEASSPGSFFERRSARGLPAVQSPESPPPVPEREAAASAAANPAAPTGAALPAQSTAADWRHSALDRFKKMPDLTKRSPA